MRVEPVEVTDILERVGAADAPMLRISGGSRRDLLGLFGGPFFHRRNRREAEYTVTWVRFLRIGVSKCP